MRGSSNSEFRAEGEGSKFIYCFISGLRFHCIRSRACPRTIGSICLPSSSSSKAGSSLELCRRHGASTSCCLCDKGTLLGTPNREPQEYSRNIVEYKDPGRYIPIIYLLYSWGFQFGVHGRVPLCETRERWGGGGLYRRQYGDPDPCQHQYRMRSPL